jgi:putative DNA primase/helicase
VAKSHAASDGDYTREENDATFDSIHKTPPRHAPGWRPGDDYTLDDSGNAERFADRFGQDYRYNHSMRVWHHWNGSVWAVDEKNQVQEDAKRIAGDVLADALAYRKLIGSNPPKDQEKHFHAMLLWAKASGMEQHISKALKLASSIECIAVTEEELNTNKMLLAFPNGYLNMLTDEFTDPCREELVTQCCAAEYHPDAHSDLVDQTLQRFVPDAQARLDLQVAFGYSLTGRGKEHLFNGFGGTKCGKTTIVSSVANAMGDYAVTVGLESFMTGVRHSGGGTREDLVRMVGKRLILASEASDHQRLNTEALKRISGGADKQSMRANYGRQFESMPTYTLWMLTNHQPKIPADDAAIWERLHVLAFTRAHPARGTRRKAA